MILNRLVSGQLRETYKKKILKMFILKEGGISKTEKCQSISTSFKCHNVRFKMYFDFVRQPFPHPQTELLFTFESSLEMNDISQLFTIPLCVFFLIQIHRTWIRNIYFIFFCTDCKTSDESLFQCYFKTELSKFVFSMTFTLSIRYCYFFCNIFL